MPEETLGSRRGQLAIFYLVSIALALGLFAAIAWMGEAWFVTPDAPLAPRTDGQMHGQLNTLLHVLLALAVVIVTARTLGALFKFLQQPPVIGEVLGGIMLGPSLLGYFAPGAYLYILPPAAAPFLGVISQLGVILYMFVVGLELDLKVLRSSGHATLAISHASIIAPFLLGAGLALMIYESFAPDGVAFTPFALFLGVSMSITAFPVLARILSDRRIQRTRMGIIALTCAAVDDVTAWCLLAFVVSVTQATLGAAFMTLLLTLVYIAAMFIVVRPLVVRVVPLLEKVDRVSEGGLAIIFVALLLSALATELIGIHAIFGAFLLGAITPHDSRVAHDVTNRLEDLVRVMFLPAFFAFTGMRTQISLLSGLDHWLICLAIIGVATLGKFGGTFLAARLAGLQTRDASALGILMNTRGLVELIVLNIGFDLGIITPTLFTMLVVMALVTTFMTTPILHAITRKHPWATEPAGANAGAVA